MALLADHVDRPHAQRAIGVAVGDAIHETRHWQHKGAGRLHNWVVPFSRASTSLNGNVAASRNPFASTSWTLLAQRARGGDHASCGQALGASSETASLSHTRGICPNATCSSCSIHHTPSQAWDVPLRTDFRCPAKYGADHLDLMADTCHNTSLLNVTTKLFEQKHFFGTPQKGQLVQFIFASIGFTLSGSPPTMSSMFPEASSSVFLFIFPQKLLRLSHVELPRVRRRHARKLVNREIQNLRNTDCQWIRAFDSTFHSSVDQWICV